MEKHKVRPAIPGFSSKLLTATPFAAKFQKFSPARNSSGPSA